MGRLELLVVVATALLLVATAWLARSGLWKRGRVALVAAAVVAGTLLVTRRLGWGELAVLAVVLGLPVLLLAPGRRRPGAPRS